MISCTYNRRKDGNLWHERTNDCQVTTKVETKDIPPIVLIKVFEHWNKPKQLIPKCLFTGNYPQEFLDSLDNTWLLDYLNVDKRKSWKTLPIGVYNISTEEKGLIDCLDLNLEDRGCIKVVNGDLENICKTLNDKTKELLKDYTQPYNHPYILIEGGPFNGKCFIPSKKLIISQYDCSILNLPKNKEILKFVDEVDENQYGNWLLNVNYIEDSFKSHIVFPSYVGNWDIEFLHTNEYCLVNKKSEIEDLICSGTLDHCLDMLNVHSNAYQKNKEIGKKLLANCIINTYEDLVL
jgi:hypothetical protein